MNARALVLPALVLAVGGGLALWAGSGRGPAPPTPPAGGHGPADGGPAGGVPAPRKWHAQPVHREVVARTEKVPARIRSPEAVSIASPFPATAVEDVHVRPGQAVKRGDPLVTFQGDGWRKVLEAARKAGDAGKEAEAERALASLVVRAPVDGIVHTLDARRGERPVGKLPLVVLFDWRKLEFEAVVPAALEKTMQEGADFWIRTGKGLRVLAAASPRVDPGVAEAIPVLARPLQAPEFVPVPGEECFLEIQVGTREVHTVPLDAVRKEGGLDVVHVVTVTGALDRRKVVLGETFPGRWVAVTGVAPPESVAVWE